MAKSTAVKVPESSEVSAEVLLGDAPAEIRFEDPEVQARQIVERILEAADADSVLTQSGTVHARDMIGRPFTLKSVRWNRSKFEGVVQMFALLDGADETGPILVTCGSRNVMAQVHRLVQLEALPRVVKIVEGSVTEAGFTPLWLSAA